MLKKLRLRLTLINLAIILALFVFLTAGTYCFSKVEMTKRSEAISRRIADDINAGIFREFPNHGKQMPPPMHHFFVETDSSGNITIQSSEQPLESNQLVSLVQQTLQQSKPSGFIYCNQAEYFYYKTPLSNKSGMLILFQDTEHEKNIRDALMIGLSITGIVCLMLSFWGSCFMANRALLPIQKAWQQQKDFLADASHELRTPLAVVQTNLEIIIGNQDMTVASQNKWLYNIKEEFDCMSKLINSLLFLARADSHQQNMDKTIFSLDQAASNTAELFELLAAVKNISIAVSISSKSMIYGDEAKIKQAIGIILDNAIRHTPAGGKISLQISRSLQEVILVIADTGEGIAEEHLEKIFDRFYQIDKARYKGGAGLGLAIAKWTIENHGGVIQVSSIIGLGTDFTIRLPLT